ncbi:hypothetical protein SAMN05216324_104151 [Chryseobacterium limigenitum]|uniref:Uncharacterized protein n=1 Tax=Chryseobacterium limigenitum TaxID=1612149 RepID=A0A1K2ILE8_9FLAO|nr:hypothetical protein SAMN05216324_104151 [Chryseobacterium limigenitum]
MYYENNDVLLLFQDNTQTGNHHFSILILRIKFQRPVHNFLGQAHTVKCNFYQTILYCQKITYASKSNTAKGYCILFFEFFL